MNKVIETINIGSVITKIELEDDTLSILAASQIKLTSDHSQDCCERVYADWSVIEPYKKEIEGKPFGTLIIKAIEREGILLCFDEEVKVFIPCYNEQSGYYSGELSLVMTIDDCSKIVNISEFVEDCIF